MNALQKWSIMDRYTQNNSQHQCVLMVKLSIFNVFIKIKDVFINIDLQSPTCY